MRILDSRIDEDEAFRYALLFVARILDGPRN
jgi:hypothetical protein